MAPKCPAEVAVIEIQLFRNLLGANGQLIVFGNKPMNLFTEDHILILASVLLQ